MLANHAIIGHLVADAVTTQQEDTSQRIYSANSAVMLCQIASLNECERLDPPDFIDKLYNLYVGGYLMPHDEAVVALSPITAQAIKNFSNGMSADQCGLPEQSADDYGALMRVLPISIYFSNSSIDTFLDNIETSTSITHKSLNNIVCCSILGLMLRNLLLQKKEKVSELLLDYYKTKKMNALHSECVVVLQNRKITPMRTPEHCLWSAYDVFAKYGNDAKSAILNCQLLGKHSNPIAIIASSLISLAYGTDNMPDQWMKSLVLTSEVKEHVVNFLKILEV